ncbi:hypothetical protein [Methylomonas rapida]|uniref:Uncharacterized protein n=1 Tax=Methylomonas rapida TaxID=2963939 RepID=A0ABY7GI96_9GAMM|nr:hypothetical protein [Methylomonas rapida]WAR43885.1 hypothetical protein NM686_016120 [Methylomonas rapida]
MVNWAEEAKALADLVELLALEIIDAIAQPDARQVQALYLITEAGQQLYAASINLKPDGEQTEGAEYAD